MSENNIPTSWNYGSFHLHSRLYTPLMQRDTNASVTLRPKYEPLANALKVFNQKGDYVLPPHGTPKYKDAEELVSSTKAEKLSIDGQKLRNAFTSTGFQSLSKSQKRSRSKVATEEYCR